MMVDRRIATVVGAIVVLSLLIAVWVYILQAHASYEVEASRAAAYGAQATAAAWRLQVTQTAVAQVAQATRVGATATAVAQRTQTAMIAKNQKEQARRAVAYMKSWQNGPQGRCLMQAPGHDVTILVRGHSAQRECNLLAEGNYDDFGSYVIPQDGRHYEQATNSVAWPKNAFGDITIAHHICRLTFSPLTIDVFDDESLTYGQEICQAPGSYLTLPVVS